MGFWCEAFPGYYNKLSQYILTYTTTGEPQCQTRGQALKVCICPNIHKCKHMANWFFQKHTLDFTSFLQSKKKKNTHVYIITSSKIKPAILTSLSFKVFHNLTLIYHPSLIYYLSIRILHSHVSSAIQRPWLTFILKLWWTSFIVSSLAKHQENSVRF